MKTLLFILTVLCQSIVVFAQQGHTVVYHLYVNDTVVNYTGKPRQAIAINGSIPAPQLNFTEGDTAEIYVHNEMNTETSIHWHGLLLPNEQDGVPFLTTSVIEEKTTHFYKFPIVQSGTYWYHSHTKLQEQVGMYGAFIIHKKQEEPIKEYTVLLSDWINESPYQVHRSLHGATDWYAIKKGATQNYGQAIKEGYFKTKVVNEWKRMLAMDVSDVYYDRFLTNGKVADVQSQFKAGERVRLRIINGSSSTYFWLKYSGGKITAIANDGADVRPVEVDRMIIGVAETYDVVVTIPNDSSYEFLATSEDRTKSTSLWLGSGTKKEAKPLPRLKYFEGMGMMNGMMNMDGTMDGTMDDMGMQMTNQVMDMNTVMYSEIVDSNENIVTLKYGMLQSPVKTTLPDVPTKVLRFELTGNMNRYIWTIDNKTVSEADKILIKKGENVRIIIYNNSMMRHPMHLHGHFFRLLNGYGEYSPLKTVLDIMPMETDTIEFAATESGDWFFHCHILYHMMSGMGRVFTYENSPPNPQLPDAKKAERLFKKDDRELHPMAHIGIESTGSDGEFMLMNIRYRLQTEWRIGTTKEMGYETESHFGRYFGRMQFLFLYAGWDYRYRKDGDENTKDNRQVFCAGLQYMLPLFLLADIRLDHTGDVRFQISREDIPVTNRLRLGGVVNSDLEYMIGARYVLTKYFSLSSHYDSDMMWGGGFTITY
jgi:FtsP/CotA-like multicopper oxidase with cupredoxin domain